MPFGSYRRAMARGLVALLVAGALATPIRAAEEAPYDDQLARLAELLGALHHLRPLCGASEAQIWREQMQAILEAEQPSPARRARLVERFNQSYRSLATAHTICTPASRELAERYRREGEMLGRDVLARYGRP